MELENDKNRISRLLELYTNELGNMQAPEPAAIDSFKQGIPFFEESQGCQIWLYGGTSMYLEVESGMEKVEILRSVPLLNEAAIEAARQFKFKPGKQRDKLVKVWVSIPFNFSLRK